jgi:O-antigen/teichoic acid export membrane protein
MSSISKIIKNKELKIGSAYTIGNIFNKGISFLMLPVLTRMLSVSDYGIVCTYVAVVNILLNVLSLSLHLTVRTINRDDDIVLNDYIKIIVVTEVAIFSVVGIISFLFCVLFHYDWLYQLVVFCFAQSFFEAVLEIYLTKWMMEQEYKYRMIALVAPNILTFGLSILFIRAMTAEKYMGRIYGGLIAVSIIAIPLIISAMKKGRIVKYAYYLRWGLSISLPLIVYCISYLLMNQVDRVMITNMVSSYDTGLYSVAGSIGTAPTAVTSAIEALWLSSLSLAFSEGRFSPVIIRKAQSLAALSAGVCASVLLLSNEIIMWWVGNRYKDSIVYTIPMISGVFVQSLSNFYLGIEYQKKQTGYMAKVAIAAGLLNALLNWLFIPVFGAIAAAYTTLISYLLMLGLHVLYIYRKVEKCIPILSILPACVVFSGAIILCVIDTSVYIRCAAIVAVWIYVFFLNNNEKTCFV